MSGEYGAKKILRKRPLIGPKKGGIITKTLSFIQSYDKAFQILAISIPGLAFTYLYNQFQEIQKQLETINSLKASIISEKLPERRVGFWLLLSLPNKNLIQAVFYALPDDIQDRIIIENLVPAIQSSNASNVGKITATLCDAVKRVEAEAQTLPYNGAMSSGHLIQLVDFWKNHDQSAKISHDLIKCGSIITESLPPPPGQESVLIDKEVLAEAVRANNSAAVRSIIAAVVEREGNYDKVYDAIDEKLVRFGLINRNFALLNEILDTIAKDSRACLGDMAYDLAEWPDSYFTRTDQDQAEAKRLFERYKTAPWNRCIADLNDDKRNKIFGKINRFSDHK